MVAGDVTARVVVHHGLRDAYSLETYLVSLDRAALRMDMASILHLACGR